jgi:thymidylate synthase
VLNLSEQIKAVSVDEVEGVFTRIEPDDISLEGYQSHAAIKATMAA